MTYLRTKLEVEDIDAIVMDQEFGKMSKLVAGFSPRYIIPAAKFAARSGRSR